MQAAATKQAATIIKYLFHPPIGVLLRYQRTMAGTRQEAPALSFSGPLSPFTSYKARGRVNYFLTESNTNRLRNTGSRSMNASERAETESFAKEIRKLAIEIENEAFK
jgi:hypothetical protein